MKLRILAAAIASTSLISGASNDGFDTHSPNGWIANKNRSSWSVVDGTLSGDAALPAVRKP